MQCDTHPVRALNLWSRRHGDVTARHMRNATIAPPLQGASERGNTVPTRLAVPGT
ncbi:hypothetical protein XFF6166_920022 [Xanthomonas citri pv. fuscans]|nr:hypothetical protein XFF6166_920022 [Xanthomonas citri pv. fuscans]SOO10663.1 hypothetical protein XFF6970_600023 [Xanthomonas citri pv. fuscans]SOO12667.1 hypothetical protein XFF7766_1130022 [Xanthomonas citri pv. fuscans]